MIRVKIGRLRSTAAMGDMAAYYQTAVLPARPRKPRDKAKVEQVGLIVERWLLILDSSKTL